LEHFTLGVILISGSGLGKTVETSATG